MKQTKNKGDECKIEEECTNVTEKRLETTLSGWKYNSYNGNSVVFEQI